MASYSQGGQPCDKYKPQIEGNPYASWNNVHECFGPYPAVAGVERCGGTVSFCENCLSDHHSDGWYSCPTPRRPEPDGPPAGALE